MINNPCNVSLDEVLAVILFPPFLAFTEMGDEDNMRYSGIKSF